MLKVIKLTENYYVSPQIFPEDLPTIKEMGFDSIINNRPEAESDDQPKGEDLKVLIEMEGLSYHQNPIVLSNLTRSEMEMQAQCLNKSQKTLAFCRTGTRSSVLWVLNENIKGGVFDDLVKYVESMGIGLDRCMEVMLKNRVL